MRRANLAGDTLPVSPLLVFYQQVKEKDGSRLVLPATLHPPYTSACQDVWVTRSWLRSSSLAHARDGCQTSGCCIGTERQTSAGQSPVLTFCNKRGTKQCRTVVAHSTTPLQESQAKNECDLGSIMGIPRCLRLRCRPPRHTRVH